MADTKDGTTLLEYLVAGLVVLSFGLLYYLLNHSSGFWPGNNQSAPTTYSGSTYIQEEVAEENQGLAGWLKTSPEPEAQKVMTSAPIKQPETGKQTAAVLQETIVPEPNTPVADATARQQEQTAQLQSSLNDELVKLRNEVAQHKAEISQLKQAAAEQAQEADMQKVLRAKPEAQPEQPQMAEDSFGNELQQLISSEQTNKAITLDKIFFNTGSAKLKSVSLPQIEAVAKQLMDNEQTKILIRGHSDNTGSVQQNSLLSLSRSGSMKKALGQMGVEANRIRIEGVGPLEPIASNETAAGREKNRRIELIVIE